MVDFTWTGKTPEIRISLSLLQYAELRSSLPGIERSLEQMRNGGDIKEKHHLGRHVYLQIESPYRGLNLRQWFRNVKGDLCPGKGIFFKLSEWVEVVDVDQVMDRFVPELKDMEPCSENHNGQLSWIACSNCNADDLYLEYL